MHGDNYNTGVGKKGGEKKTEEERRGGKRKKEEREGWLGWAGQKT